MEKQNTWADEPMLRMSADLAQLALDDDEIRREGAPWTKLQNLGDCFLDPNISIAFRAPL